MKLSTDILGLLDGPVAISVATCDADHWPNLAHGYGVRVEPHSGQIRIFVLRPEAEAILANIVGNGAVAAVFSDVSSFRSLQIKGGDATLRSFDAADAARQRGHHRRISQALRSLGYAAGPAEGYFGVPAEGSLVTLAFTPRDLYQQSPGPEAGLRLDPAIAFAAEPAAMVPLPLAAASPDRAPRSRKAARVTSREHLLAVTQL